MTYTYLDDRATADVAFRATGACLEELFSSAVDALLNTMVQSVEGILPREQRVVTLHADSVEMLLFELLQAVIFAKDADRVLLRALVRSVTVGADWALAIGHAPEAAAPGALAIGHAPEAAALGDGAMPTSLGASCEVVLQGERIDPSRHELVVDVKGVTLHGFTVAREADGWTAEVVLDV